MAAHKKRRKTAKKRRKTTTKPRRKTTKKRKSVKRSRAAKKAWAKRRRGDSTAAFMSAANKRGHSHFAAGADDTAAFMSAANKRGHHVHVHVPPKKKKR